MNTATYTVKFCCYNVQVLELQFSFLGGFLKLSSDGLKPITIQSPPGPLMGGAMGGVTTPTTSHNSSPGSTAINNDSKRDNPFLQFVANTR